MPPLGQLELTGDIQGVHDPDIIEADGVFYLFSTGNGIQLRTSDDLTSWQFQGRVFDTVPSWITTTAASEPDNLWAPEIARFNGLYHLYYSASSFGSQQSCIGHATRASLTEGEWEDDGQAVICSLVGSDYNAIDPSPVMVSGGQPKLYFGSFWGGIYVIDLDAEGKRSGDDVTSVARRPGGGPIEAANALYRDGRYYLFTSFDSCCQGSASTYYVVVNRSDSPLDGFVDETDFPALSGGGTRVTFPDDRWVGPGHSSTFAIGDQLYLVHHAYDTFNAGTPTLRIASIAWSATGWPTLENN